MEKRTNAARRRPRQKVLLNSTAKSEGRNVQDQMPENAGPGDGPSMIFLPGLPALALGPAHRTNLAPPVP
jgi:hypothetical protein